MLEDIGRLHGKSGLVHARDDLHVRNRITARTEEVVVDAHLCATDALLPDVDDFRFQFVARCHVGAWRFERFGRDQLLERFAVHLAVWRQRHRRHLQEVVRHHVVWQNAREENAQIKSFQLLSSR
ncbi:hypothetical protein CIG75_02710 [Tumebacillus algifaecis]|uniref:Uncharacterized protein n=1 Tax=Tumebacillus algifaecis TaxID=1214604 RepID=A0A223CXR9_9BACL|nr:hypothetical protein CIG75_02710 [Tumebacillus algifaecis]